MVVGHVAQAGVMDFPRFQIASSTTASARVPGGQEVRTGGLVPIRAFLGAVGKPVANPINESFADFGVSSLWHITDIENVPGIMRAGILSHRRAYAEYHPVNISDACVQDRRSRIRLCNGRKLHEYAVTYINVRNPMLYKRREQQWRLCLLEISPLALEGRDFAFTDRNAAARDARFFHDLSDLQELPWDVLRASSWHTYPNGKQQRCAEVLVPDLIAPEFVRRIWAYDQDAVEWLAARRCNAVVDTAHFFHTQGRAVWH